MVIANNDEQEFFLGAYEAGSSDVDEVGLCDSHGCRVNLPAPIGNDANFLHTMENPNLAFFKDSLGDNALSTITNTAEIGEITFARGSLTGTKDNTPVEFQTFAGWLDGGIFGITQVSVGETGSQEHRFIPYTIGTHARTRPSPTGNETSATWEGNTVASAKTNATFILGDAKIDIDDLANPDVDLMLDNWRMINGQVASDVPAISFDNMEIRLSGVFGLHDQDNNNNQVNGAVSGYFQGSDHNSVIGIFNTEDVVGTFGGVRQEAQ